MQGETLGCPMAGKKLEREEGEHGEREYEVCLVEPWASPITGQEDKAREHFEDVAFHGWHGIIGRAGIEQR